VFSVGSGSFGIAVSLRPRRGEESGGIHLRAESAPGRHRLGV